MKVARLRHARNGRSNYGVDQYTNADHGMARADKRG